MSTTPALLNINEDLVRRFTVQGVRTSDGALVYATGLALEVRIAASRAGAAISAGLVTDAAEYVDEPGFYHADFDTADLVSALATRVGQVVYLIVKKVGDLDCVWWSYRVATSRPAD